MKYEKAFNEFDKCLTEVVNKAQELKQFYYDTIAALKKEASEQVEKYQTDMIERKQKHEEKIGVYRKEAAAIDADIKEAKSSLAAATVAGDQSGITAAMKTIHDLNEKKEMVQVQVEAMETALAHCGNPALLKSVKVRCAEVINEIRAVHTRAAKTMKMMNESRYDYFIDSVRKEVVDVPTEAWCRYLEKQLEEF